MYYHSDLKSSSAGTNNIEMSLIQFASLHHSIYVYTRPYFTGCLAALCIVSPDSEVKPLQTNQLLHQQVENKPCHNYHRLPGTPFIKAHCIYNNILCQKLHTVEITKTAPFQISIINPQNNPQQLKAKLINVLKELIACMRN